MLHFFHDRVLKAVPLRTFVLCSCIVWVLVTLLELWGTPSCITTVETRMSPSFGPVLWPWAPPLAFGTLTVAWVHIPRFRASSLARASSPSFSPSLQLYQPKLASLDPTDGSVHVKNMAMYVTIDWWSVSRPHHFAQN
jgi:hypothetical protein